MSVIVVIGELMTVCMSTDNVFSCVGHVQAAWAGEMR